MKSARTAFVRRVLGAALLLSTQTSFAQENEARSWLLQMSSALRSLNYQGSFIYEHNGQIDALRIFHDGDKNGRERLISMSGSRSEIVREGNSITCVQAGEPSTVFPNRFGARLLPLVPETRGSRFAKFYSLTMGGEDRVAGYRARIIDVMPRDGWRYGYRLWLDTSNFMLLRSAVIDTAKRPLEQFMFVALDVGAKPKESDLALGGGPGTLLSPDEIVLSSPPRWRVADPPPGFDFLRGQHPAQGPTQAEHYTYSDGVANVSVYIEPRDPAVPVTAERASSRGVLSIYSRSDGAWTITALGDAPGATVQRIARSVVATNAPTTP